MKRTLLIVLTFLVGIAQAQIPKAQKKTFVNDYANVLDAKDLKVLNQKIYKIQKETGVQLAIVLVNEVPEAYSIETYAAKIGKKWHVGTNKRGLVYVAAIQQHQQRLAVAENLRDVFTNTKSEAILASIKNAYRNEDYNGGLTILVNKIHTTLVPASDVQVEPVAVAETPKPAVVNDVQKPNDENNTVIGATFVFSIVLIVVIIYYRNKLKNQRIAAANYEIARRQLGNNPQGVHYGNGGYSGGSYRSNTGNGIGRQRGRGSSGAGSFLAGAALGAAGGYGARYLQDKLNEEKSSTGDNFSTDAMTNSFTPEITEDNNSDNWGNWGAGDTNSDSGFSDNSSSSYSSSDNSSSGSSSSGDSGFSDSGGSSDNSGSTSNW